MAGQTEQAAGTDISPVGSWFVRHPIATFLVLVYATTGGLGLCSQRADRAGTSPWRSDTARHPVVTFMIIGLGAGFLTASIRPIANSDILPFELPLHGVVGGVLGVVSAHSWSRQR